MKNYPLFSKKFSFLLILFFCASIAFSQRQSKIYNKKGQLIADTTYSISKKQLKLFKSIEDTLIAQLLDTNHKPRLEYPEVEREAEINSTSIIVSYAIKDDLIIVKKTTYPPGGPGFIRQIKTKLNQIKIHSVAKYSDTSIYYLAFGWQLMKPKVNRDTMGIYLSKGKISIFRAPVPLVAPHTVSCSIINSDASIYFDLKKCEQTFIKSNDTSKVKVIPFTNNDTTFHTLFGYLVDRLTGKPLVDVNIDVTGKFNNSKTDCTYRVFTDKSGYFSVKVNRRASFSLSCFQQRYHCLIINAIKPHGKKEIKIKLQPD